MLRLLTDLTLPAASLSPLPTCSVRETFEFAAECQSRSFQRGEWVLQCAGWRHWACWRPTEAARSWLLAAELPLAAHVLLCFLPLHALRAIPTTPLRPLSRAAGGAHAFPTFLLSLLPPLTHHPPTPAGAELLEELHAREEQQGISVDPELEAFMKAQAFGGRHSLAVELMLHMLGLEGCADTGG